MQVVQHRPTASAEAIDRAHLARYTFGDIALEHEIFDLFVGQAPLTIDRLVTAASAQQWREAAHTLKGSARAIGAWQLAAAAESAEKVAGWLDRDDRMQAIAMIQSAYADVEAYVARCQSGLVNAAKPHAAQLAT